MLGLISLSLIALSNLYYMSPGQTSLVLGFLYILNSGVCTTAIRNLKTLEGKLIVTSRN
jgi:hypothetical protein